MNSHVLTALLIILSLTGTQTVIRAQAPLPIGDELQVNSYTTGPQNESSVDMDDSGNFIVVWRSALAGSGIGVQAQRFDFNAGVLGNEFQINSSTSGDLFLPDVAMNGSGGFIVAWLNNTDFSHPRAQRFNSAGLLQGQELILADAFGFDAANLSTGMAANGDFAVVFQFGGPPGVAVRRFDSGGGPAAGTSLITGTLVTRGPALAMGENGDFVVVTQGSPDFSLYRVFGQRIDAAGVSGDTFQVSSPKTASAYREENNLSISMDGDNGFVVVWDRPDGSGSHNVHGQRLDSSGAMVDSEFQVNSVTTGEQENPSVAMDHDGNFVVVWQSPGLDGETDIKGQRFDLNGAAVGGEFQINSYVTGIQTNPAIEIDVTGDKFVVVWESEGQDGSDLGIRAQLFEPADIFQDGFESGDTSAWPL